MYIREYLDVSVGLIVECLLKTIRHANLLIRCLEFGDENFIPTGKKKACVDVWLFKVSQRSI